MCVVRTDDGSGRKRCTGNDKKAAGSSMRDMRLRGACWEGKQSRL